MFPEYRELISKLKTDDAHFLKVFKEHNALDHEIKALEQHESTAFDDKINQLKKEKLRSKEELLTILKSAQPA